MLKIFNQTCRYFCQQELLLFLLLAIMGTITVFAFAPFYQSYIVLFSLLCLLLIIDPHPPSVLPNVQLLKYGYVYGLAYFSSQLYWIFYSLYKVIAAGFWLSLAAMIMFSLFLATYIVVTIITYNWLKTNSIIINVLFLFPSLWVLFEWLRGWFLSGFPWCEIGYTQVNNKIFQGFYPLIGNYGVSWLVISLVGIIYIVINQRRFKLSLLCLRLVIIYAIIGLIFGILIRNKLYTKPYGNPIEVALLQGNISETTKWKDMTNLQIYQFMVKEATADIILIPETAISQFEYELPAKYLSQMANSVAERHSNLITGIPKIIDNKGNYVNAAMVLTSSSHPYYAKYHLVPYGEYIPAKWLLGLVYKFIDLPMVGFTPGKEYQKPLNVASQSLAFNICYENGFNSELIYAARKSTLMVNLSDMIWYGMSIAKDQHLQLSRARALENQRYFIQVTNSGLSAVIRPDGKIQSILPPFRREILQDYVGGRVGITPFERYGNWLIISWVTIIIAVSLFLKLLNSLTLVKSCEEAHTLKT